MWDETDYTARWIQGICAIFLAIFAIGAAYVIYTSPFSIFMIGFLTAFFGAVTLCYRCIRYAITGRNNINRDDY